MTNDQSNHSSPTHHAYSIRKASNDKNYWTKIGAAWEHKDGKGFNVDLECFPIDGKISLRVASEKKSNS